MIRKHPLVNTPADIASLRNDARAGRMSDHILGMDERASFAWYERKMARITELERGLT